MTMSRETSTWFILACVAVIVVAGSACGDWDADAGADADADADADVDSDGDVDSAGDSDSDGDSGFAPEETGAWDSDRGLPGGDENYSNPCTNGEDEDGDGLIDCDDPGCYTTHGRDMRFSSQNRVAYDGAN